MLVARVIVAVAWIVGAGSLALFGAFLWTGTNGGIDLRLTHRSLLLWDASLCLLFFFQHSVLIRRSTRRALSTVVPEHLYGIMYTLTSAAALVLLIAFWQDSGANLYRLAGVAWWALRVVLLLAFLGIVWGIASLEKFDAFGIDAYRAHLRGSQNPPVPLTVKGPYRLVRHPFYAVAIVALWATPVLSADRLLFNVLFTGWIVIGAYLEERDLLADFGETYVRYRSAVPMFVPRLWRRGKQGDDTKKASHGRAA